MKNGQTQIKKMREKEAREKMLKERQTRNVRSRSSTRLKQNYRESDRSETLNSIRKFKQQNQEREINMFDFLFSFGGLC